jgi:hypothetical protein
MRLESGVVTRLGQARIGMLALRDGRHPLVNPAAFHHSGDSIWMTTSRYAVKLTMARRDPRAAFVVEFPDRSLLLQGALESYDLRSVGGSVRAALDGPRFGWGMAGYTLKNAPFVAGYLLDLMNTPGAWWPHNRVVLRLRADHVRTLPSSSPPGAHAASLPGIPSDTSAWLAGVRQGYLCWSNEDGPLLVPCWWALGDGRAYAWLPPVTPRVPARPVRAALVVQRPHAFRATRMLGACLRGEAEPDRRARVREALNDRYGQEPGEAGQLVRLDPARVTWWQGFEVGTVDLKPAVRSAETDASRAPARRRG